MVPPHQGIELLVVKGEWEGDPRAEKERGLRFTGGTDLAGSSQFLHSPGVRIRSAPALVKLWGTQGCSPKQTRGTCCILPPWVSQLRLPRPWEDRARGNSKRILSVAEEANRKTEGGRNVHLQPSPRGGHLLPRLLPWSMCRTNHTNTDTGVRVIEAPQQTDLGHGIWSDSFGRAPAYLSWDSILSPRTDPREGDRDSSGLRSHVR